MAMGTDEDANYVEFLHELARFNEDVRSHCTEVLLPERNDVVRLAPNDESVFVSPLNYVGSKRQFLALLDEWFPPGMLEYREPFFGGGNAFFHFADRLKLRGTKIWVNEFSRGVYCYLIMVRDHPEALWNGYRKLFDQIRGNLEQARKLYDELFYVMENGNVNEAGIACALANHLCFSGMMKMGSFSPRSVNQECASRQKAIWSAHRFLRGVEITNLDFHDVISPGGDGVFLFLDPPYDDTQELYQKTMNYEVMLQDMISTKHAWLLTHSDTIRHRGRMLLASVLGKESRLRFQFYEMGRGVNNKQNSIVGKEIKENGERVSANDMRLEVLLANYDPTSDIWKFWKAVAKDKLPIAETADWVEIERQIEAGEGTEI